MPRQKGVGMASKEIVFQEETYRIGYELVNPTAKRSMLILHGWGANREIMKKAFSRYLPDWCHIYVDLPGFGTSTIHTPLKSRDYQAIMLHFLEALGKSPEMMIGHSFGGKIATLLNPKRLVLLSSAGIVPKKALSVRLKIALYKCLKKFGGAHFYKFFATKDVEGMSQVMYETLKNVVDEDMSQQFMGYDGESFIFWGTDDKATPLKSGETIHRYIQKSEFFPLQGDHFFFLLHAQFIANVIEGELC